MWRPFVEVGNVSQSRVTDNRQTRYAWVLNTHGNNLNE
ncbi:oligogalacturonate-specific porin KdgM family protein [Photobacterium carnosum]|nr:oligogalacturonate-specific porin KdgM family protein [Photobacterium carnosum]